MTHAQLTEKINLLGYQGFKEAYQRQNEDITYATMSFEERVYQLLDAQEIFLKNKRITMNHRLSKIKDERNAQIQEIESKLETVSKEVEEIRKSIEKEIANIEEQRAKVYEQKEKLISKMSQKIMVFYEKIRKWAVNTTVVPVKKQACYGCFMRINDKTYADAIKGEEIITCPHCGRVLYIETEENK